MDLRSLKELFQTLYHRPAVGAVRAPGRVNLIGEHTDYNDGFVLPIAIERQVVALFAPRKDRLIMFRSLQAEEAASVRLDSPIAPGSPSWANYCKGVTAGLLAAGAPLAGADTLLDGDVPLGGGLGSSAAIEVATALALLEVAGAGGFIAGRELALLCQKAEHQFAGAPCGIMDQTVAILGQAGKAMLLDCRSGQVRHVPFDDPGVILLVADTQVKHDISDGGYAARRQQCHSAARRLGVAALRDADEAQVAAAGRRGELGGKELMCARHVTGEIARTLAACEALSAGDHRRFGELMFASHASLREDYEASCEELDAIVEAARKCHGVHGARMTGGGFGGCAIILAGSDQAGEVTDFVQRSFRDRFGRTCPIFATRAVAGAGKRPL
jgi:galactokinase